MIKRLEDARQAHVYGIRPKRLFIEAATKYLDENQHKYSLPADASRLKQLIPFIGELFIDEIHMGTLQNYIQDRRQKGLKTRTINHGLKVVRHILNLAASEWIDECNLTWLHHAPKIKLLPEHDSRAPYPITREEQARLFNELPTHLQAMAEFAVNTGCRDREICRLQWQWEIRIPELDNVSVFLIPAYGQIDQQHVKLVKNGQNKLVVLNKAAQRVIETRRGIDPVYVFTFRGKRVLHMTNSAWRRARERAGLAHLRVHDLRHTFGSRLRAAGVSLEDREDLLGHKSQRMTSHYSSAEIGNLLKAVNLLCQADKSGEAAVTILRLVS